MHKAVIWLAVSELHPELTKHCGLGHEQAKAGRPDSSLLPWKARVALYFSLKLM